MSDLETTINFLQEDKTMTVFTSQRKWLNKLLKYANEKDSNVIITHKNTDGSAMFEIPDFCFNSRTGDYERYILEYFVIFNL